MAQYLRKTDEHCQARIIIHSESIRVQFLLEVNSMLTSAQPTTAKNIMSASNRPTLKIPLGNGLAGETAVTIRPVTPADLDLLVDLHGRLSDESLFKRFLRPYRPTVRDIAFITNLPMSQGAALMATRTSRQQEVAVGLAYYVIEDTAYPVTAEPAFVVDDWYQGQGIGTHLFEALRQTAVARQIKAFNAVMHPANSSMMRIFEQSGLPLRQCRGYGEREVHIRLQPAVSRGFLDSAV
jgi:RimJ/RimL family protein N-acetyltransferase